MTSKSVRKINFLTIVLKMERQKFVLVILFFSIVLACKKETKQNSNALIQSDTTSFSIDINSRLFFADSITSILSIDTATFSRPSRLFYIYLTDTVETLIAGFIDTSSNENVPVKMFTVNGDSVSAYFNYNRITSTDTILHCNMLSGTFTITSSDTINKRVSGNFQAVLFDPASGDTIRTTGDYSNFKVTLH